MVVVAGEPNPGPSVPRSHWTDPAEAVFVPSGIEGNRHNPFAYQDFFWNGTNGTILQKRIGEI